MVVQLRVHDSGQKQNDELVTYRSQKRRRPSSYFENSAGVIPVSAAAYLEYIGPKVFSQKRRHSS